MSMCIMLGSLAYHELVQSHVPKRHGVIQIRENTVHARP